MPLHIKDRLATQAVRTLAARRSLSLTEAVRVACEEALERDTRSAPIAARLAPLLSRLDALPASGAEANKAFFDREWGESE